ncbi:MAG: hypothetical protein GEV10_08050 [Streptosporangiales bacterium]|nr:hypothetical protein [Streptosporangiales bacterium]
MSADPPQVNVVPARSRAGRVWTAVTECARREGKTVSLRHACIACAEALPVTGAGLSLSRGPGHDREPVYSSDPLSDELEELQFTIGEGPCVEALGLIQSVLVSDLSTEDNGRRWPAFAPAAVGHGVRAVFAMPLAAGAVKVGVLGLYRRRAGSLTRDELTDAYVYADAALALVLDDLVGVDTARRPFVDGGFVERSAEVHQATGMMSVQLGVGAIDALARLRAYAYVNDRRVADVAGDVVDRRLRFSPGRDTSEDAGS